LLGDVDLAADAVQHAFVKLCAESHDRLEGRVAPWLFRVCSGKPSTSGARGSPIGRSPR
jgi:DNA-directed RNA polymerase specialized sigma24 family protein